MKPMATEIENGISRTANATIPPVSARGTPLKTSTAFFTRPKNMNSMP
jgi:hypothetical protein